jgi:hypothetical protein
VQRMYDKGQSKRQSLIDLGLIKDWKEIHYE